MTAVPFDVTPDSSLDLDLDALLGGSNSLLNLYDFGCQNPQDSCRRVSSSSPGLGTEPTGESVCVAHAPPGAPPLGNLLTQRFSTPTQTSPNPFFISSDTCPVPPHVTLNEFHRHGRLDLSHLSDDPADWTLQQRRDVLNLLKRHMQNEGHVSARASVCGYKVSPAVGQVEVWQRAVTDPLGLRSKIAHYRGIRSCGCRHECVYCSRRAGRKDVLRLHKAAYGHIAKGRALYMAALTLPHNADDEPEDLLNVLMTAWQLFNSGRKTAPFSRHHCSGWTRTLEVTYGPNGAHFHLHVLIFRESRWAGTTVHMDGRPDLISQRLLPQVEGARMEDDGTPVVVAPLSICASPLAVWWESTVRRWKSSVEKAFRKVLNQERVCMVRFQDLRSVSSVSSLARYLSKQGLGVAFEMGYGFAKRGRRKGRRTPFQLLFDVATEGNSADVELWRKHRKLMHGTRVLASSMSSIRAPVERDPFKRYADVEPPPLERADGWKLERAERVLSLSPWVYRALWRRDATLELLHHVEACDPSMVQALLDFHCHDRVPGSLCPNWQHADDLVGKALHALRAWRVQSPDGRGPVPAAA